MLKISAIQLPTHTRKERFPVHRAVGGSIFDVAWDGMGTLIDSSSGGLYAFQNNFTGSMLECSVVVYGGTPTEPTPCAHGLDSLVDAYGILRKSESLS
jgi:hypothetical protein